MKFLVLTLAVVVAASVLAAGIEGRRHGVPLRAVIRAQLTSIKRTLAMGVWALMAVPVAVDLSGYADPLRLENARALAVYYGLCVVMLWVLSAWPFNSRSES